MTLLSARGLRKSYGRGGGLVRAVTHASRIAATADRLITMRDGACVDETRLTGGTSGSRARIAGLDPEA